MTDEDVNGEASAEEPRGDEPPEQKEGEDLPAEEVQPEIGDPQFGAVINNFYAEVQAEQATFGTAGAWVSALRSATGRLGEQEIASIVRCYARPAMFDEAAAALSAESVIVLTGDGGIGRRAGAIALLYETGHRTVVVLSPAITAAELAKRSFTRGYGYLVADLFDEDLPAELAEFTWHNVRSRVEKAGAHLVVTAGAHTRRVRPGSVTHLRWERPAAVDALRAHLNGVAFDDHVLKAVSGALGTDYPVVQIGDLARRIGEAEDAESVLAELDDPERQHVADWLNQSKELRDVLDVAALIFTAGVPERAFESLVRLLAEKHAESVAGREQPGEDPPGSAEPRFRQRRRDREQHPLIAVERVAAWGKGPSTLRRVAFRVPGYRAHVVDELWNRADVELWEPVRAWLNAVVVEADAELANAIAVGIALLAHCAPDEVIESYLDPWSAGTAGLSGQTAAAYVLWRMSRDDGTVPLALMTAIQWAGQGSRAQRRTAALTFSGALGARFPTEAVRRLCQLGDQGESSAGQALAQLFATLADHADDAVAVLKTLRRRLQHPVDAGADRRAMDRALLWTIDVLSARDPGSGRPAAAVFLAANPSRREDIASLWASTLLSRPRRVDALIALWNTLATIEIISSDTRMIVRSLGAAIGNELPNSERALLRADLSEVADRRSKQRSISGSLLEVFMAACEAAPPK